MSRLAYGFLALITLSPSLALADDPKFEVMENGGIEAAGGVEGTGKLTLRYNERNAYSEHHSKLPGKTLRGNHAGIGLEGTTGDQGGITARANGSLNVGGIGTRNSGAVSDRNMLSVTTDGRTRTEHRLPFAIEADAAAPLNRLGDFRLSSGQRFGYELNRVGADPLALVNRERLTALRVHVGMDQGLARVGGKTAASYGPSIGAELADIVEIGEAYGYKLYGDTNARAKWTVDMQALKDGWRSVGESRANIVEASVNAGVIAKPFDGPIFRTGLEAGVSHDGLMERVQEGSAGPKRRTDSFQVLINSAVLF